MSALLDAGNAREARGRFKDILDAAHEGRPVTVSRSDVRVAAVDAERFVRFYSSVRPAGTQLVDEGGRWSIFIPGLPLAADGATVDEAIEEMIGALRDYAEAWTERLRFAPNHEDNWGLVQLVGLASDEQLRAWLAA